MGKSKGYTFSIIFSIILLSGAIFGTTNSVFAPSEVVDQSNSMSPSGAINIGSDFGFILGQQFVPTASDISSVDIGFRDNTAVDETTNVKVTIWQSASLAFTSGTLVGSVTQLVNEGPSYDDDGGTTVHEQTINFQFASPLTLTPGLTYVIQVEEADVVSTTDLSWTAGTAYSSGIAIQDGSAASFADYTFATYTLVPTPPSVATIADQTVAAGASPTFTAVPSGDGPFTYQWYKDAGILTGETGVSLSLTSVTDADEGDYSVVVTGAVAPPATSNDAALTVETPPSVATIADQTVAAGASPTFTAVPSGDGPFTYQWYKDAGILTGETGVSLSLTSVTDADEGDYSVVVTGAFSPTATSNDAELIVETPVSISGQPVSGVALATTTAMFMVVTGGDETITYQWQVDEAGGSVSFLNIPELDDFSGTTSSILSIANAADEDEDNYRVIVDNPFGPAVTSDTVALTVNTPASITDQPVSVSAAKNESDVGGGDDVSFSVTAVGDPTITYQWQKNGVDILEATNPTRDEATLDLGKVIEDDEGSYTVVVSNGFGSNPITSAAATLTVTPDITDPVSVAGAKNESDVGGGDDVNFSTTAVGDNVSYQWQKNGVDILEATNPTRDEATLDLGKVIEDDEATYVVIVSDDHGFTTSAAATLTVTPDITDPVSVAGAKNESDVGGGDDVDFSTTAVGDNVSYQWQKNGGDILEATNPTRDEATLDLGKVIEDDEATYVVIVSDDHGFTTSDGVATLTVTPDITDPVSVAGAVNESDVGGGDDVDFSTTAVGDNVSYQWQKNGGDILEATNPTRDEATLDLGKVIEDDEATYVVIVSDDHGFTTSAAATLTVTPDITDPVDDTIEHLDSTSFSTTASGGDGTVAYQWRDSVGNVPEAAPFSDTQTDTLVVTSAINANEENYDVQVTDDDGTTTSATAELIVRPDFTAQTGDQPSSTVSENKDKIFLIFTEGVTGVDLADNTIDDVWLLTDSGGITVVSVTQLTGTTATLNLSGDLNTGVTPTVNYDSSVGTVTESSANLTPMTDKAVAATDGLAPEVASIASNQGSLTTSGTIADLDTNLPFTLEYATTFTEVMNTAMIPSIDLSTGDIGDDGDIAATLTESGSSWDVTGTIFTFRFTLTDAGKDVEGIGHTVTGGQDDAPSNNDQLVDGDGTTTIDIDNENPTIAPTSLTIVSSNTFDATIDLDAQVATAIAPDTITVELHASESLDTSTFILDDDVTIQGVGDSDVSGDVVRSFSSTAVPNDTITGVLTVDTDDTEGDVTFVVKFRDVFGNEADVDANNIPDDATETDTTDGSKVVLDYTPPPTVSVVINNDDLNTFSRLVDVTLGCDDANGGIAVAECYQYRVDGDEDLTGDVYVTQETYPAADQTTITSERGLKTVTVSYIDRGGNVAGDTSDDINLDSTFFTLVHFGGDATTSPPNESGIWEDFEFDISGVVTHPRISGGADKVKIDMGFLVRTNEVGFDSADATFDVGEPLYEDVDNSADVSAGDRRLDNHSGNEDTIVYSGDADVGTALESLGDDVRFVDSIANFEYDSGEALVEDNDESGDVSIGDRRLSDNSIVANGDADQGDILVSLNRTFDFTDGFAQKSNIVILDIESIGGDEYSFSTSTLVDDSREFPRNSENQVDIDQLFTHLFTGEATLVESDGRTVVFETDLAAAEVDEDTSNQAEVLERDTTITLNVIPDTYVNNRFAVTGGQSPDVSLTAVPGLIEDVDGTGVPLKLIEFENNGAPEGVGPLEDLTDVLSHAGVTFEDNDGIVVSAGGIMELKPSTDGTQSGGSIITPHNPGFVSLTIEEISDDHIVELLVTTSTSSYTHEIETDTTGPILVTLSDLNGISKVEVSAIFPVGVDDDLDGFIDEDGPNGFNDDNDCLDGTTHLRGDPTFVGGPTDDVCFDGTGTGTIRPDRIAIIDEDGIEENPVPLIGEFLGLTNLETRGLELELINQLSFTADSFNSKTFDTGFFFSEATAQSTSADNLKVDAIFTDVDDPDYLPSTLSEDTTSNEQTYSVFTSSLSGFSNTGTATIKLDTDKGVTAKLCAAGDDIDGDGICDSWETGGVPYKWAGNTYFMPIDIVCPAATCTGIDEVLPSGRTANLLDEAAILAGTQWANDLTPEVGVRDIYIEIDSMTNHPPDIKALNDVIRLYADATDGPLATQDEEIRLHIFLDEGRTTTSTDGLTHLPEIQVWRDADDNIWNDSFNDIKKEHYGTRDQISPFITKTPTIQVKAIDAPNGEYNLLISGMQLTTPSDPRTVPTIDRTSGTIAYKIKLKTDGDTGLTIGNSDRAAPFSAFSGAGTWFGTPFVTAIQEGFAGNKFIFVLVNYATSSQITDRNINTLTLPITLNVPAEAPIGCTDTSADNFICTTDAEMSPEFPQIDGKLKAHAYSQVYRYAEIVHSFGGPSGEAELRGNDMVMALGEGFGTAFNGHPGGTRHQQSGTFAHELLHLLNGLHGGPQYLITDASQTVLSDTTKNCKPYPGVDKYTNQMPNIYLDLALSDPTDPRSDVLSTSEWQLAYSDGSHGHSILEVIFDGATGHIADLTALGGAQRGLTESMLNENLAMPGTPYTMVWASPAGNQKQISNSGNINWDVDGSDTETDSDVDLNNFGISGCVAGDDAEYYDYDAFFHMDFDFKQGPSGAFDGLTNFVNDATGNALWRSIASDATFEGIDPEAHQTGEKIVKSGSNFPIEIQLFAQAQEGQTEADELHLGGVARAQVWVSKDPNATVEGTDPRDSWVPLVDANPYTVDSEGNPLPPEEIEENAKFMRWVDPPTESLIMDWKTPRNGDAFGLGKNINLDGDWFIRIVMSDNPLGAIGTEEGTPEVCPVNTIEQTPGGVGDKDGCLEQGYGLFGAIGEPNSNFLQDLTAPCINGNQCDWDDAGEHLLATAKVKITKQGPGNDPEPPGTQELPVDNLIGTLDAQEDAGNMKKKTHKDLRKILVNAKNEFVKETPAGDAAGCALLDDFEDDVHFESTNNLNVAARTALKAVTDTTQGAPPLGQGCYIDGESEDGSPVGVPTIIPLGAPNSGPPGNGNGN